MIQASSLAFPGSRTLAGWARQLAPFHPQTILVGYLFLHRIEALVRLTKFHRVDRLCSLILQVLQIQTPPSSLPHLKELDEKLHLGLPILSQILRGLEKETLVQQSPEGRWILTDLGRQAAISGEYPGLAWERRAFYFVESLDGSGKRRGEPQYLLFSGQSGFPWPAEEECGFDPLLLRQCLGRDEAWKKSFGFPLEVLDLAAPLSAANEEGGERTLEGGLNGPSSSNSEELPAWKRIILDRPERRLVVLICSNTIPEGNLNTGSRLVGFSAHQDGWVLDTSASLFSWPSEGSSFFQELAETSSADVLIGAWKNWCQARGIASGDAEACTLSLSENRLLVKALPELAKRLHAGKSDVSRKEAWLLLGEGYLRRGVHLEIPNPS